MNKRERHNKKQENICLKNGHKFSEKIYYKDVNKVVFFIIPYRKCVMCRITQYEITKELFNETR